MIVSALICSARRPFSSSVLSSHRLSNTPLSGLMAASPYGHAVTPDEGTNQQVDQTIL